MLLNRLGAIGDGEFLRGARSWSFLMTTTLSRPYRSLSGARMGCALSWPLVGPGPVAVPGGGHRLPCRRSMVDGLPEILNHRRQVLDLLCQLDQQFMACSFSRGRRPGRGVSWFFTLHQSGRSPTGIAGAILGLSRHGSPWEDVGGEMCMF